MPLTESQSFWVIVYQKNIRFLNVYQPSAALCMVSINQNILWIIIVVKINKMRLNTVIRNGTWNIDMARHILYFINNNIIHDNNNTRRMFEEFYLRIHGLSFWKTGWEMDNNSFYCEVSMPILNTQYSMCVREIIFFFKFTILADCHFTLLHFASLYKSLDLKNRLCIWLLYVIYVYDCSGEKETSKCK